MKISNSYNIPNTSGVQNNNSVEKINTPINQNQNIEPSSKDQLSVTESKKGKAASNMSLDTEENDFAMPLLSILGTIAVLIGSIGSSASYNPELMDASLQHLRKTTDFIKKHGMGSEVDFMGNLSAKKPSEPDMIEREHNEKIRQQKLK